MSEADHRTRLRNSSISGSSDTPSVGRSSRIMKRIRHLMTFRALMVGGLLRVGVSSRAEVIFTDNFDSGASSLWENESGSWSAAGGVYAATAPNNFPNAFSSLPFNLTNFFVDVDIQGVTDGGIWLRSTPVPGT